MTAYAIMHCHVMETKTSDTTAFADKTILLIISDQKVNGTDDNYNLEWDRVSKLPLANIPRFNSIKPEASKTWTAFNEDFKFSNIIVSLCCIYVIEAMLLGAYKFRFLYFSGKLNFLSLRSIT